MPTCCTRILSMYPRAGVSSLVRRITRGPLSHRGGGHSCDWARNGPQCTEMARTVLEKPPDRVQVLRKFIRQFSLPGWDVSRVAEVQSNLRLLNQMAAYMIARLAAEFAGKKKARLSQAIARRRR